MNRASERDKDATFWRRACEKAYCVTSATSCQNVFFVWRSVLTPIAKTVTFPFLKTARAVIFSRVVLFFSPRRARCRGVRFLAPRCRPATLFARASARSATNRQDGQVHEPHGAQPVVQEPPQRCVLPPSRRAARRRSRRSALFSRHRETLAARDIHFSRERPTTAWCLRLLRRERPRIRREVFGNAMTHSIASRRRAAWLASPAGPAASSRIGFSRL